MVGLVGQQCEHARDGRGLAGAGTAGDHGGPLANRAHGCVELLLADPSRPDPLHCGGESGLGDVRWWLGGTLHEVVADLRLEPVVAVEVEQVVLPADHSLLDERRGL